MADQVVPAVPAVLAALTHVMGDAVMGTVVRARVADHLDDGPLPAKELAARTGLDPLSTVRGLRYLSTFGVFQEVSPEVFGNTAASNLLRNRPGGLRNLALFLTSEPYMQANAGLRRSMMTGESAFEHVHGRSFWDFLNASPEDNDAFNRIFAELRGDEHIAMTNAYDWSGTRSVVDVGGGNGSLLATILERNAHLRGTLFDQEGVLAAADEHLTARGVRGRCSLIGGSFLRGVDAAGDVWLLSQILHDWSDGDCAVILGNVRARMGAGDRLLVAEMVTVPGAPHPMIAMLDMQMMMLFGNARQRTAEEYRALFADSGLELTRVIPTASLFSLIEARRV